MAEVFSDNFNRADSSTLGAGYTTDSGAWGISSNKAVENDAGESLVRNNAAIGSADYKVEAIITYDTANAGIGVSGRVNTTTPTQDYYLFEAETGDVFALYKRVGGTYTLLGSWDAGVQLTDPVIMLSMQGTTIKGFVNGTERVSVTDSAHSAEGDFGLRGFGDLASQSVDDLKVYTFDAGNPYYAYAQQ